FIGRKTADTQRAGVDRRRTLPLEEEIDDTTVELVRECLPQPGEKDTIVFNEEFDICRLIPLRDGIFDIASELFTIAASRSVGVLEVAVRVESEIREQARPLRVVPLWLRDVADQRVGCLVLERLAVEPLPFVGKPLDERVEQRFADARARGRIARDERGM